MNSKEKEVQELFKQASEAMSKLGNGLVERYREEKDPTNCLESPENRQQIKAWAKEKLEHIPYTHLESALTIFDPQPSEV